MRLFPGSSLPFHVLKCKGSCEEWALICLSDMQGYGRSKMQTFLWPPEIQEAKKSNTFFQHKVQKTTKCVYVAHKEGKTSVLWELVWGPVWMFHLHSFDLHLVWQSLRDRACIRQSVGHTRTHAHTQEVRGESSLPQASFELTAGIYSMKRQQNTKQEQKKKETLESVSAEWRQPRRKGKRGEAEHGTALPGSGQLRHAEGEAV